MTSKPLILIFFLLGSLLTEALAATASAEPSPFVVQLTRSGDNFGHRRAFLQIDRVLNDIGEDQLKLEVVAYEEGIFALLQGNTETAALVSKLANSGVVFKVCTISMRAWNLQEDDFAMEVEFIPAGAPEMIRLQMQGYRYWLP